MTKFKPISRTIPSRNNWGLRYRKSLLAKSLIASKLLLHLSCLFSMPSESTFKPVSNGNIWNRFQEHLGFDCSTKKARPFWLQWKKLLWVIWSSFLNVQAALVICGLGIVYVSDYSWKIKQGKPIISEETMTVLTYIDIWYSKIIIYKTKTSVNNMGNL